MTLHNITLLIGYIHLYDTDGCRKEPFEPFEPFETQERRAENGLGRAARALREPFAPRTPPAGPAGSPQQCLDSAVIFLYEGVLSWSPAGLGWGCTLAANPFLRLVLQRIRAKGGWYPILERIASGEALTKIAKDYECSRHTLYLLLHKKEQLWNLFVEARRESAMALAEEGTGIIDELSTPAADGSIRVVTREDIALAKTRVEQRRWLAQSYDRETFGIQAPESSAPLSIGSLHLQVLMTRSTPKQLPSGSQPRVVEAEIVSEEPAHDAPTSQPSQS